MEKGKKTIWSEEMVVVVRWRTIHPSLNSIAVRCYGNSSRARDELI